VEEYLHSAIKDWLPTAIPTLGAIQAKHRRFVCSNRATALAETMQARHGDFWLTDLLASSHASGFPRASIFYLSQLEPTIAVTTRARRSAHQARSLFRSPTIRQES